MNCKIYTLTSELHDETAVNKSTQEFLQSLNLDYDFKGNNFDDYGTAPLSLIYVRTGGTEGIFNRLLPELCQKTAQPFYLLTSGKSNSLAASMEILSFLRQQNLDGDNKNGESDKAGKKFFNSENEFRPAEFMHFCSKMLVKEPKEKGKAPCMILFCEFEQQFKFIELGKKYGLPNYINLVFRKDFSAQVLKANMKVVGNCEYGLIFYRDKLPKFNNNGKMIYNCMDWQRDTETPKIHPTQKPVQLLERLISIFTDEGETVIDPCCGSGSTLLAAQKMCRKSYGFEVDRNFFNAAKDKVLSSFEPDMFQALKYYKTN